MIITLAVPASALAQPDAQRASDLNDEGIKLWKQQNNLPDAIEKFRQATALSPDARYLFNLCYALHQSGQFREALTECEKIESASGLNEDIRKKSEVIIADLNKRVAAMPEPEPPDSGIPPDGGGEIGAGGGDPADGGGTDIDGTEQGGGQTETGSAGVGAGAGTGPAPPVAPVPELSMPADIPDDYKWSIGGYLGFHGSNIGSSDLYTGGGFKAGAHTPIQLGKARRKPLF
ncbi:MAG: hypothetical protein AAF926_07885 [Pseudomonadota bacterium]